MLRQSRCTQGLDNTLPELALNSCISEEHRFRHRRLAHPVPPGGRDGFWDYSSDYIGDGPTPVIMMKETGVLLELLTKQMTRLAPKARIGTKDAQYFTEEDSLALSAIFSELI